MWPGLIWIRVYQLVLLKERYTRLGFRVEACSSGEDKLLLCLSLPKLFWRGIMLIVSVRELSHACSMITYRWPWFSTLMKAALAYA